MIDKKTLECLTGLESLLRASRRRVLTQPQFTGPRSQTPFFSARDRFSGFSLAPRRRPSRAERQRAGGAPRNQPRASARRSGPIDGGGSSGLGFPALCLGSGLVKLATWDSPQTRPLPWAPRSGTPALGWGARPPKERAALPASSRRSSGEGAGLGVRRRRRLGRGRRTGRWPAGGAGSEAGRPAGGASCACLAAL